MCALFIGGKERPTADTLKKIGPVLVTKSIVEKMINFFCQNNHYYGDAGVAYSQENMDALFAPEDGDSDVAVPQGVEITYLAENEASLAGTADYTQRSDAVGEDDVADLIMESVTYASGDHAANRTSMKARALSWALSRNRFLVSRSGSAMVSDDDPALLAYLWPWLDPFGIGGFHHPKRTPEQRISLEQQVRNLLRQTDSPFQTDPTFAFICFNMLQKKEVNDNSCFRVQAKSHHEVARDLREIAPSLDSLADKLERNRDTNITDKKEKKALSVLKKMKTFAKNLKGSAGYKQCRRNEIRSLLKKYGTPAFFGFNRG
ncbi:hypothetical protein BJ138DRAFT_1138730 [Hygrophoropsis aurantiaca]|uniref:Uncharacterized protein n=1 Tax=Hygrophoropsis aurantiaca TaxID=72124 RepID=A0ACB7ZRJ1_9AGAM|nr:hypothetical protein BJ138DRAFT_1138730 [Hygrophoropsis aurantiaca]